MDVDLQPKGKMEVELEDVRATLVACFNLFRSTVATDIISEGAEHIKRVTVAREKQLEVIRNSLRALSKTLESTKAACNRPSDVPTREEHLQTVENLEQKQYEILKSIGKLEGEISDKMSQISRTKDEAAIWELKDPVADHEVDNTPLRAQIWKGLGFELRRSADGTEDKVLIRTESGDLRLKAIPKNLTPEEVNAIWDINAD
ncbi:hypothetical protein FRC17_009404 [Serendipita sp. 399]|nr:hypothetical protein FRC17_009404 [Serendipita sp. 399]